MKHIVLTILLTLVGMASMRAALTLDSCLSMAEANYPAIRQYAILSRTRDIDLSDINRGWLPRIGVYAQGTVQNEVPAFPEALSDIVSQMGRDIRGIAKEQYKIGIDLTQTVWDGGASASARRITEADHRRARAAVDTELYAVRERVQQVFFGILLLDRQIDIARNSVELLEADLAKIRAMIAGGTAMQADADMIEAQILSARQQILQAESSREAYRSVLGIYIGEELGDRILTAPEAPVPAIADCDRPELRLFAARQELNTRRSDALGATVMPRIGFFAQGYYGYPGLNYFASMTDRKLSLNLLAGLKISWNIDSFYTRDNNRRKYALANESIAAERDVFLFNTRLRATSESRAIDGLRRIIGEDDRIVELRGNVRRAAESQLSHGVIDANALLTKITDEQVARLNASLHQIQLLQSIYQLKYTLNQ